MFAWAALLICLRATVNSMAISASPSTSTPSAHLHLASLQTPHPPASPAQTLRHLADECDRSDIQNFDVYGDFQSESSYLRSFEARVAAEFGKDDGVFMPSGVMAQSIALLIHDHERGTKDRSSQSHKSSFICHDTSHLLIHEKNGYSELCGMKSLPVGNSIQRGVDALPMSFDDVESIFESLENPNDVTSLILELPHRELGGKLTPWADVLRIKDLLGRHNVAFHCDGARIFEASAGYGMSLSDMARPFDSIYVSFYKGLGGISGAMLLGSKEFCDEARVWLRRFGGNLYTLLPYAVSGQSGYEKYWISGQNGETDIMSFSEKRDKLTRIVQALTNADDHENDAVRKIVTFTPSIPQVNMVHIYIKASLDACVEACSLVDGVKPFHRAREIRAEDDSGAFRQGYRTKLELYVGHANGSVPEETFVSAWRQLCDHLENIMDKQGS